MSYNPFHNRVTMAAIGQVYDPPADGSVAPWSMVSLLKGILHILPPTGAPGSNALRGRFKDPKFAIGAPEDAKATNTTDDWSMPSLLKGILEQMQAVS